MGFRNFEKHNFSSSESFQDTVKISNDGLVGSLSAFSGKSGDFFVAIIPSLKVTGYGETEGEALKDLEYNLDVFCDDIFSVSENQRHSELKKLGFSKHRYFKKRFEGTFIDKNGVLQNFDNPENVKVSQLVA